MIKSLFEFAIKTCIFSVLFWGLFFAIGFQESFDAYSIFVAWLLMMVSVLTGFALFLYSLDRDSNSFYTVVFGGLVGRMFFLVGISYFFISQKSVRPIEFVFGLGFFYLTFFVLEAYSYLKRLNHRNPNSSAS